MHLETLLYMLLQSDKTVPPPGAKPDFAALARKAQAQAVTNRWNKIPARTLKLGLDDPETDDESERYFGWDNEKPVRTINVLAFEAQTQPLTNGDYARYLAQSGIARYPASWIVESAVPSSKQSVDKGLLNGYASDVTQSFLAGKAVRTVYGPVPLEFALDWPVMASYDELAGCAKWFNGRIPTLEEAESIYAYVDELDTTVTSNVCARTIPAVNG
jgi:formylglycine-generating enzyme required for sulfatase activity